MCGFPRTNTPITGRKVILFSGMITHERWKYVKTFPKHFHNGSEENVVESNISDTPEEAIREFLTFVRNTLKC
jgi:hypothetical protein